MNWPAGVGGKGNEGVAGLVTQTPGSIGYVELIYALQNKIALRLGAEHGAASSSRRSVAVGDRRGGRRRGADAGRLPRVDHQRAGQGRLPDLVVHLAAALREPEGQGAGEDDGGLHEVGARPTARSSRAELGYAPLPAEVVKLELAALEKVKTSSTVAASDEQRQRCGQTTSGSGSAPALFGARADR